MNKKILRIQKKSSKIIGLFMKMVEKLLKQNEKLQKIIDRENENIAESMSNKSDAENAMGLNLAHIEKLQSFMGKEDNIE